jgi:hypothetical protein
VIFGLRAVGIVGLRAVVSCRLETSPCRGGAAEIFNFESNTCNLFSFVQPLSAGSNNPATVSPAADHVNPSPQSGGHTCSLHRRSRDVELCDVELVIINL